MHRRVLIASLAFASSVLSACGSSAPSQAASEGQKGKNGVNFVVTVPRPVGGIVRDVESAGAAIECGPAGSGMDRCAATFAWNVSVRFVATPVGTNLFQTWAGDCSGEVVDGCLVDTRTGGADKTVAAVFNPPDQIGHAQILDPARHSALFFKFVKNRGVPGVPQCTRCHGAGYAGNANAPSCNACHAAAGHPDWLDDCTFCHGAPPPKYVPPSTSGHPTVPGGLPACVGCHPSSVTGTGAILADGTHMNGAIEVTGCDACHAFPPPSGAHLAHWGLTAAQGTSGYGDLGTLQTRYPPPAPPGSPNAYAFGCGHCHPVDVAQHSAGSGSTTAKVVLYEANGTAGTLKGKNAAGASYGAGKTCSGVYCHGNGAATPAWTSGETLACNGCHGTGTTDGRPDYPSGSPKANSHDIHQDQGCAACHAGTTTDGRTVASAALHVNGSYDVQPGTGVSFTYAYAAGGGTCSNVSCHFGGSATWGAAAVSHLATLGSGEIMVFEESNVDHGAGFTMTESCSSCHYTSLVTQHAGRCELCHQGANPARTLIGTWAGGCSEGACHAAPPHLGRLGADHRGIWQNSSAACDRCHDTTGGTFPGPGDNCSRCHAPSFTAAAVGDDLPPTTTSDAVASYVGTARIKLVPVDAGSSGVSLTWWAVDGRAWNLGTDVSVGPPVTGSRAHTLQFYSTDHALNVEQTHTVSFTVQAVADTVAPTTVSSFNPAAGSVFRAVQPVVLTATDGASGVKATYYRIDSGAWTVGTSFSVTDGLHTFGWYSVDNAGNTEAAQVSASFRVDTIAPVTTSSAANGATYDGAQVVTLSASDAGSGVTGTWYQLDGAAFVAGTSVAIAAPSSGSASHTLRWYSVDAAGNQEATRSATFTVRVPVVDVTPPTTVSSFNPAPGAVFRAAQPVTLTATDDAGGSGVKATYFQVDAGGFTAGSSFVVSEGVHTFSWYSVDVAGNAETVRVSSSFRVDTVPPVTTSTVVGGSAYTGGQTFTLAATDVGGSGVLGTWYQLDGGTLTAGNTVAVAAPSSGTVLHTLTWYSVDVAGNQETTRSASFTVAAGVPPTGTVTLSFRTNFTFAGKSGWDYVYWEVQDANGNTIDSTWNDSSKAVDKWWDVVVPAGVAYVMYGAYGPMENGPDLETATNPVSAAQAVPGATITWWWQ